MVASVLPIFHKVDASQTLLGKGEPLVPIRFRLLQEILPKATKEITQVFTSDFFTIMKIHITSQKGLIKRPPVSSDMSENWDPENPQRNVEKSSVV